MKGEKMEKVKKIKVLKDVKMELWVTKKYLKKVKVYEIEFENNEILTLQDICKFFLVGRLFDKGGMGGIGYSLNFEKDEKDKKKIKKIYLSVLKNEKIIRISRLQSSRIATVLDIFLRKKNKEIQLFSEEIDE